MSWSSHIDAMLATGTVRACSIHSLADGGLWAGSPGFTPSQQEAMNLSAALQDEDRMQMLIKGKIVANGASYMYVRHDPGRNVYAKQGATGLCVCKSTAALIIATYVSPMSFEGCIGTVEKVADYLISMQT
eukprot:m.96902 g.96902  ORF g.96902 m.96902 type:complete len:131 (-) comp10189_c0_seq1:209-601(-)